MIRHCGECKFDKKNDSVTGRCMKEPEIYLFTKHEFPRCRYFDAGKYAPEERSET